MDTNCRDVVDLINRNVQLNNGAKITFDYLGRAPELRGIVEKDK